MLLESLEKLPESGWRLDITGSGPLAPDAKRTASLPQFAGKVFFHGVVPDEEYLRLMSEAQVGLNCQRISDPISEVTFPSKIFTYLSADLMVLSSVAGAVRQICGKACAYFEKETSESLASAMTEIIRNYSEIRHGLDQDEVLKNFSPAGTAVRLREFLEIVTNSS
jgi:glycosyltransferase involved in cell wall biosynthesis